MRWPWSPKAKLARSVAAAKDDVLEALDREAKVRVTFTVERGKVEAFIKAGRAARRQIEKSLGELVVKQMLQEYVQGTKTKTKET